MKGKELEELVKRISRLIEHVADVPVIIITTMDDDGEVFTHAKGEGWETVIKEALENAQRIRAQRNNEN